MFAIFGLLAYLVIGLAWLAFAMLRLMVWLVVVLISAASSAITRSPRRRAPQPTMPGRLGRPASRPTAPPMAVQHDLSPLMAAWARGSGGQVFRAVDGSIGSLRRQLLLPRPADRDEQLAYWQRVLRLATTLENLAAEAMTSAPQMPGPSAQSQWNMALDHAQHGAADLREALTGKGGAGYTVAMRELKTAETYIGRLISQVPRSH